MYVECSCCCYEEVTTDGCAKRRVCECARDHFFP